MQYFFNIYRACSKEQLERSSSYQEYLFHLLKIFSLKFWLKNLDCKTVLYLVLVAMFLDLMQILSKVTKLFFRKPLMKLSFDDKRLPHMYWRPKILLDQDLLSPHQNALSGIVQRPNHLS